MGVHDHLVPAWEADMEAHMELLKKEKDEEKIAFHKTSIATIKKAIADNAKSK